MKKILLALFLLTVVPAQAGDIFRDEIPQSQFNITTATVIKAAPGVLVGFAVVVAGAAGTINDAATTGSAAAANVMMPTPAVVGVYYLPMQFKTGLVVTPGAGQTIAISYQ